MTELGILIVLIFISGFFSLSETAITAVSRIKVRKFFEQKTFGSKALYELREHPNRMLTTILVGNNLVNIAAASLATSMIIEAFKRASIVSESAPIWVSTLIMTSILLVFGEITPKTIAIKSSEKWALRMAPVINITAYVLSPFVSFFMFICRPLIRLFGADTKAYSPFITEEEIKMLLSVGEEEGILEQEEKEMIHSIFEFSDTMVKEVMMPRPDMICMNADTEISKAAVQVSETGLSRFPVFEGSEDNIIGQVLVKDILKSVIKSERGMIRKIMKPALFVPESKKLDDLMRQMQSMRTHIAVVVDEYGGIAGLVTLEDLLEEIVGEIKDEFDNEEKQIEILSDGSALVDARMSVSDVNEKLATSIPDGDYDTIGGFVLSLIGRLPMTGDKVRFEGLRMSVEKVQKRRITRIRIVHTEKEGTEESVVGG